MVSTLLKELFEVNALRLAHEFLATYTLDSPSALRQLQAALLYMEQWEVRLWMEHLGTLIVEEGVSADQLHVILTDVETLSDSSSTSHLIPSLAATA